jgi:hypothetical protein
LVSRSTFTELMDGGWIISGGLVIAALGGGFLAAVTVTTRGRLRTMLLAVGALAIAFATFVLIGIINNPG